jgi:hypothetical protein
MDKKQILLIQAKTDLQELRKDVEAGLYKGNPKGFKKELERIERKTSRVEDLQEEYEMTDMEKLGAWQNLEGEWEI